jgi:hypothetical protein
VIRCGGWDTGSVTDQRQDGWLAIRARWELLAARTEDVRERAREACADSRNVRHVAVVRRLLFARQPTAKGNGSRPG